MEQAPTTKPCSVCGKDIETAKYRIHEATCARNNYKCAQCNEVVAKAEKDHHEAEFHAVVKCQHCEFQAEKPLLKDHEFYCSEKPQQCRFCEIQLGGQKLAEHEDYCGSKSRKCTDCQSSVTLKDWDSHKISGACSFTKEINQAKAVRELEKFQMEQQKIVDAKLREETKAQRERKEEQYIQQHVGALAGTKKEPTVVQYDDGRKYIKKPAEQPVLPQIGGGGPPKKEEDSPAMNDEDLIAKLLQEELDAEDAQRIAREGNFSEPSSGFPRGHFEDPSSMGGVRRGDSQYEEQLIGGPSSGFGFGPEAHRYEYTTIRNPDGSVTTNQFTQGGFQAFTAFPQAQPTSGPQLRPHIQNIGMEDSHMADESGFEDEDAELQRVLRESQAAAGVLQGGGGGVPSAFGGSQSTAFHYDDTEDEILRHIMEQSKNEK